MNVCLNLVNANLTLGVNNLVLGFFDYTEILELANL